MTGLPETGNGLGLAETGKPTITGSHPLPFWCQIWPFSSRT